jgi:hypothetical protein
VESSARDVLPTGVRRRLCLRDGMLPMVLLGELMAGVALGAAWPRLTTPPGAHSQLVPTTAVLAPVAPPVAVGPAAAVAPRAAVPVPATVAVPVTAPVTVPAPAPAAVAPAHTPPGTEPAARNPFFVLAR